MESENFTTTTTDSTERNPASSSGAGSSNRSTETDVGTSSTTSRAFGIEHPASTSRAGRSSEMSRNLLVPPHSSNGQHSVRNASPPLYYVNVKSEQVRVKTFLEQVPPWNLTFITPQDLASAGFFYFGEGDKVQCAFCRGIVGNWELGDIPLLEHKRHFPKCPFVCNIPVGNMSREFTTSLDGSGDRQDANYHPRRSLSVNGVHMQPFRNTYEQEDREVDGILVAPPPAITAGHSSTREPANVRGNQPTLARSLDVTSLAIKTGAGPARKNLVTFSSRLKTFTNWPVTEQPPEVMAEAGFYYTGTSDHVKCFYCDGGLKNWEIEDDAWVEHARWFGNCPYVLLNKGKDFAKKVISDNPPNITSESVRSSEGNNLTGSEPRLLTDEELRVWMETPIVEAALALGMEFDRVRSAVQRILQQTGNHFPTTESLVDAIHRLTEYDSDSSDPDEDFDEDDYLMPVPPLISAATGLEVTFLEEIAGELVTESNASSSTQEENTSDSHPSSDSGVQSPPRELEEELSALAISPPSQNGRIASGNGVECGSGNLSTDGGTNSTASEDNSEIQMDVKKALELKDEEIRELREARQCKICMDNEIGVVFLPCGHLVSCVRCATALSHCALCRQPIKAVVRTYLS